MKDLVRWFVAGLAGVLLIGLVIGSPSIAYADTIRTVGTLNEAWYLRYKEPLAEAAGRDLSCATPLGCNVAGNATRPAPALPYPDNTLHVAANTGEPDAQTYLTFDLSRAPRRAVVTGGTMTLVAAPAESGTLNEFSAQMVACRVTEPFVSVKSGSWRNRPSFDPNTCPPLIRVPGARPATWRLNLAPLAAKWSADANRDGVADVPNYGITILPSPWVSPGTPTATWKVVFDGRRRTGGRPIASTLQFRQLTRASDAESSTSEPVLPAPPVAGNQSVPEMTFTPRRDRNIRMPEQLSPRSLALASPSAAAVSDVPDSPLDSPQLPKPQLTPSTGQNVARGMPLVVATGGMKHFLGGRQAVCFVALLGFGVAGLLGWSLTSQTQLRGAFRWVAAMGLARRMPAVPTSKG
jgi:hypothetical protein